MSILADYSNLEDWHCVLKSIYWINIYFFQTDWKHNLSYLIGFWFHTIRKESKIVSFACPFHIFTTRNKIRSRICPSRKMTNQMTVNTLNVVFTICTSNDVTRQKSCCTWKTHSYNYESKHFAESLNVYYADARSDPSMPNDSHGHLCHFFCCSVCVYFILKYSFAEMCFSSGWEWCPENVISFITITSGYSKLYPFWECCLIYTRRQLIMF